MGGTGSERDEGRRSGEERHRYSCPGPDRAAVLEAAAEAGVTRVAGHGVGCESSLSVVSVEQFSATSRVFDYGGQATKGAWGMSWRQKATKGVEVCDKPGEVDKRAMIPGFPN
jgi:hypothetical protein